MEYNSSSFAFGELAIEVQRRVSPVGIVVSLLAGFVAYCVYQYYFSPLAGIPGPFTVRCGLYGWRTLHGLKFDFAQQLQHWHRSTGSPIIRISSHQVSVIDPAAIPIIYKNWDKTGFYQMFKFTSIDTGMSTKEHEAHKRQVKSDGPLFTKASLAQQEPYMDICANGFIDLLRRESVNGKTVQNLGRTLRYYTLDIIGEIAFGETFHALEKNDKSVSDILDKIDFAVYGITLGGIHPRIAPTLIKIAQTFNLFDINFVRRTASAGAHKSIERKKAGAEREDLMAKMLSLKHWSGGPYSLEEIEGMAAVFFGAGTDTAAVLLRAFVYYMVKNPEIHAKLMEELEAAVEKGELHFPTAYAECIKLPYFQACLDEVIRLHPAVPMPLPRVVPKGGAVIAGHFFPEGFEVGMSPFVVQRSEGAFGPDAEEFKPSRWLDATIQERIAMHAKILTFGTLARVCVGKNIGVMGVSKLMVNFLYHFDIAFVPRSPSSPHKLPGRGYGGNCSDDEPWNVDEGFLGAQNDFWCEMRAREVRLGKEPGAPISGGKPAYVVRADAKDTRDKSERTKGDNLTQRREKREIEDGRAVIKALEHKLQEAKAGAGERKQERYAQTSSELQLAEQQLKDEQKKVYRLEDELEENDRTTAMVEVAVSTSPRDEEATTIAQRAREDAARVKALLVEREQLVAETSQKLELVQDIISFIEEPFTVLQTPTEVSFPSTPLNPSKVDDSTTLPPGGYPLTPRRGSAVAVDSALKMRILLWAARFPVEREEGSARTLIFYYQGTRPLSKTRNALNVKLSTAALMASLLYARKLNYDIKSERRTALAQTALELANSQGRLNHAKSSLLLAEERRRNLEREVEASRVESLHKNSTSTSHASPTSPTGSSTQTSFVLHRLAATAKQLNQTSLALRRENREPVF
ncbi:cytochrome P450 [Leucosporidium creatinivorum]|uniref:Cytochrome P450 n=1 Tax=Leucosporidium creatinivorum TaxID=106004 RepID=A0A1Y2C0Y4_9BASI|nr:cytochrome P450 [Leucosporidium creatinivorum]